MRIVDRTTFLEMPAGTIFCKIGSTPPREGYVDFCEGEVCIKGDSTGEDFLVQHLFPDFDGVMDTGGIFANMDAMVAGAASPPVDYHVESRDGLYDQWQLFAVWDRDDATALVERLKEALIDGYPDESV